jgi:o-succinylbenzoate synthase
VRLSFSLESFAGALSTSVGNARSAWSSREGLWLTLRDDEGFSGYGECAPLPGYSTTGLAGCRAALVALDPDPLSLSIATLTGPDLHAALAAPALLAALAALPPPARFAVETALLDLAARRAGVPLSALLGAPGDVLSPALGAPGDAVSPALGAPGDAVARSGLLPATGDLAAALAAARELEEGGIRTIKVKIGRPGVPFAEELAWLVALRAALDPALRLRLDANGAFSLAETPLRLAALARLDPELIEEPTSGAGLSGLGACAIPWAADESLADEDTTRDILDRGACSALVLKPANLGLLRCLALATEARRRGLKVIVTHLFDGPIGLATACELALALAGDTLPCGLDLHGGLLVYPPMDIPQLREPGRIVPSGRPGHGLAPESPDAR